MFSLGFWSVSVETAAFHVLNRCGASAVRLGGNAGNLKLDHQVPADRALRCVLKGQ